VFEAFKSFGRNEGGSAKLYAQKIQLMRYIFNHPPFMFHLLLFIFYGRMISKQNLVGPALVWSHGFPAVAKLGVAMAGTDCHGLLMTGRFGVGPRSMVETKLSIKACPEGLSRMVGRWPSPVAALL